MSTYWIDTMKNILFTLSKEETDMLSRLPENTRQEVERNIHDYLETVKKDYDEKKVETVL